MSETITAIIGGLILLVGGLFAMRGRKTDSAATKEALDGAKTTHDEAMAKERDELETAGAELAEAQDDLEEVAATTDPDARSDALSDLL
jgi:hypothetical protein